MLTPMLAAVAAVLAGREVVVVQTSPLAVVSRAALPADGVAMFAAPDGRIVVPLAGVDATAVVQPGGAVQRWPGRLFPLFFDEVDRMYVIVPGLVTTLAYPERVEIERAPVEGLTGVWRAACSRDGRLVAMVPAGDGRRQIVFAEPRPGGTMVRAALGGSAEFVAVAPDAAWAVVATAEGSLELVAPVGPAWRLQVAGGGELTALALRPDGQELVVGRRHGDAAELIGFRIEPGKAEPLRERFRTPLDLAPTDATYAGDDLLAATTRGVLTFRHGGRRLQESLALPGARALAVLPDAPRSVAPAWSDGERPR